MRLGSRLHMPLYADYETVNETLYFGMRKGRHVELESDAYHVGVSRNYYKADPCKDNITRKDYLYYRISSDKNCQIGDDINVGSGNYVIFKKITELVREKLEFTYWAGKCGNWYIPSIEHDQLTGMEFIGTVVSTQKETANIRLGIDEPYDGADYKWNWTPVSGNLMYAMPETGASVRLCFGSGTASEGIAVSDVRSNGQSMPGQQSRSFMSKAGKKAELYPAWLSFQGGGGQAAICDGETVSFTGTVKTEMTAAGNIRLDAAKIHVQTPLEINMYRSRVYGEEKGKDITAKGTKSNPPTGTGDAGFTMNYEFNASSRTGILCGNEFICYKPFSDDPEEGVADEEGFDMDAFVGHICAGYAASIVFTGGATAALAPWVVGGMATVCGGAAVTGLAMNDYRNGTVSGLGYYVGYGAIGSGAGAVAGASFCMSPYAAKYAVSQIVPYGMTGLTLPGMYISAETLTNAAMLTGYSLTASNMLVMVNDSAAYMTNYNMMSSVMGQNNYQTVKGVSKFGADAIMWMGLSEPSFYDKNKYVGNIRQNALYDNSEGGSSSNVFKAPEITTNSKGELTNGTYTLNQQDMLIHVDGKNPNKSQFLYDVDANKAVLDASSYADANNLWEASSGNLTDFANKAKVPVTNGYAGVTGKGELTSYINVYRTKTGYIHGCPGNP